MNFTFASFVVFTHWVPERNQSLPAAIVEPRDQATRATSAARRATAVQIVGFAAQETSPVERVSSSADSATAPTNAVPNVRGLRPVQTTAGPWPGGGFGRRDT
ncbi:hypothetical protein [Actinocorallia sp. A-T 12471]|uniref:hypothetical protein n=1 Tax=Actinocorallia sp. A-T 12471 TaxID=3089813 RepID=UPI0029D3C47D|nr:hypothetical protein [Actinocorallia sp. A-T 12471]MDX6743787.1 hypothetical protein [Actinocorallia sp. A-T 12471]